MNSLRTAYNSIQTIRPFSPRLALRHPRLGTSSARAMERIGYGPGAQASALVQAILARYLGRSGNWARLGLIVKTEHSSQPAHSYQTQINLLPRLTLKLAIQSHRTVQTPAQISIPLAMQMAYRWLAPPAHEQIAGQSPVYRLQMREVATVAATRQHLVHHLLRHEQHIEYLLTRGQRIETGTSASIASATRPVAPQENRRPWPPALSVALPPLPPVPRIVHRSAPAAIEGDRHLAAPASGSSSNRRALPDPPDQAAAQALNVNQLADQVIQTIDRRIIARRERLGRS